MIRVYVMIISQFEEENTLHEVPYVMCIYMLP